MEGRQKDYSVRNICHGFDSLDSVSLVERPPLYSAICKSGSDKAARKEPDLHISALVNVTSEKLPLLDERNCSDSENSNFHVSIELGSRKLGSLSPTTPLF
ncbi:hypothetical protein NPIL_96941 [Nephila pilipes]|uniref:Uncharacterized protein n=1 Tax=Nephila pilipes TaxID=299642 RepID=A0A8X6PVA9_NEPPI|nr:hypothetical protein NPIL_96941 [Nephila pilipes]